MRLDKIPGRSIRKSNRTVFSTEGSQMMSNGSRSSCLIASSRCSVGWIACESKRISDCRSSPPKIHLRSQAISWGAAQKNGARKKQGRSATRVSVRSSTEKFDPFTDLKCL